MSFSAKSTLREVVAGVPNALRVFAALGIEIVADQGLAAACERADVSLEDLLAVLADSERIRPADPLVQHSYAALLHAHERVDGVLEGLLQIAGTAAKDPRGERGADYSKAAWRFVFEHTLPHLESEERYHFPLLARAGAPLEALYILGEDHAVLRQLARRLSEVGVSEHAIELSDEAIHLLRRFIDMFRWHAQREEAILSEVVAGLPAPR